MNQFLRSILDYAAIRAVLELLGVVESQQSLVQKELGIFSRTLPPGRATLIVHSLGKKENSAVSLIRQVTGLNLREVLIYTQSVPAPLLTRVSAKTAATVQHRLARVGIETEIIGVYEEDLPQTQQVQPQAEDAPTLVRAALPFPMTMGNYSVTLTSLGLLEERVLQGVERITGRTIPGVRELADDLPIMLLDGVDQDTAIKAQTMLQMVGAVVDIGENLVDEPPVPE